jgi:hypothetical protein
MLPSELRTKNKGSFTIKHMLGSGDVNPHHAIWQGEVALESAWHRCDTKYLPTP